MRKLFSLKNPCHYLQRIAERIYLHVKLKNSKQLELHTKKLFSDIADMNFIYDYSVDSLSLWDNKVELASKQRKILELRINCQSLHAGKTIQPISTYEVSKNFSYTFTLHIKTAAMPKIGLTEDIIISEK